MKVFSLIVMAFLVVGTFGVVAAEDDVSVPEAKKVGWFEDRMDRLRFAFVFDKEEKIERALELAEKRLAEAEALAEEDPERAEKARERYNAFVERAEAALERLEAASDDADKSEDELSRMARIQNKFERHRERAEIMHLRMLERLEANGASEEKIERFEMFYERVLNRSDKLEERILERHENAVRRHKALSEMSDEELDELIAKIEDNEGLKKARLKRIDRAEVRVEKISEIGFNKIGRLEERLEDSSLSDEEKARIESWLEKHETRIENAREHRLEQLEKLEERLENGDLTEAEKKRIRAEVKEARDQAANFATSRLGEAEVWLGDANLTEEQRARVEKRLDRARARVERFSDRGIPVKALPMGRVQVDAAGVVSVDGDAVGNNVPGVDVSVDGDVVSVVA